MLKKKLEEQQKLREVSTITMPPCRGRSFLVPFSSWNIRGVLFAKQVVTRLSPIEEELSVIPI
jgi:hypothetical protein